MLTCLARHEETADCASFEWALPAGMHIEFLPGQFVCLGGEMDGQTLMRAYSIASDPAERTRFRVAVRRVAGGRVSNWLLDHVQAGSQISALAPAGSFHLRTEDHLAGRAPQHVALFSAGCGITPMLAMSYWLARHRPDVHIHFCHSARSEADLILHRELEALAARHPMLHVYRFLTAPRGTLACHAGRINAESMHALLPAATPMEAYLCGPEVYMDGMSAALQQMGVPAGQVYRESFIAPASVCTEGDADASYTLKVPAFGKEELIRAGQTLLDVLEAAGVPIIGACRSGVCGACRCQVSEGHVHSTATGPLSEQDQQAGYVLACSTHARSDITLGLA